MNRILGPLVISAMLAAQVFSQSAGLPPPGLPAPILRPGEGFAWAAADGTSKGFGEAAKEAPMGSLAKLLWLRLEGEDWSARMVSFKCKGELNGVRCWKPKGHGKVDLAKAVMGSCDPAFLAWSLDSAERWKKDYGEGVARYRLDQVFKPFAGPRLKGGDTLPELGPAWIGRGDLLRTTPLAMARWLANQDQEPLLALCKRLMSGAFDGWITKGSEWWFQTGGDPVPGSLGGGSAWVAGTNGEFSVVLLLPNARGKAENLARMKEILLLPKK